QVVDRQAVAASEMPDAAAERQAADPRCRDDAAGCRQPERVCRMEEVAPGTTAFGPRGAGGGIDAYARHSPQIEDDAAVVGAKARHAVRAAAYGQVERIVARVIDGRHDVGDVGGTNDNGRPTIDHCVVDLARHLVVGIVARNDLAAACATQLL